MKKMKVKEALSTNAAGAETTFCSGEVTKTESRERETGKRKVRTKRETKNWKGSY